MELALQVIHTVLEWIGAFSVGYWGCEFTYRLYRWYKARGDA